MILWYENEIRTHLESFFQAADNENLNFIYSGLGGGPHLYCYAPSKMLGRNYWTIVTMGTSTKQMLSPSHLYGSADFSQRIELLCYLPPNWSFPLFLGEDLNYQNWPFEVMRMMAGHIMQSKEWIAEGHCIPNLLSAPTGQPFTPFVPFTHAALLDTSISEKEGFRTVDIHGSLLRFYSIIPLTPDEFLWKEEVGMEESLFEAVGCKSLHEDVMIDCIIDPKRTCVVKYHNARERIRDFFAMLDEEFDDEDHEDTFNIDDEGDLGNGASPLPSPASATTDEGFH